MYGMFVKDWLDEKDGKFRPYPRNNGLLWKHRTYLNLIHVPPLGLTDDKLVTML